MSTPPVLEWLPVEPEWRQKLRAFRTDGSWDDAVSLANRRLDFVATNALDSAVSVRIGVHAARAARHFGLVYAGSPACEHPRRRAAPGHLGGDV